MKRNFDEWLKTFQESIATYEFYVDFDKIKINTEKVKVELHMLNSLIGSKDIENDFMELVNLYPNVLKVIPILLAKRGNKIIVTDTKGTLEFDFNKQNYTLLEYCDFMRKTHLFDLLENKNVSDLNDYVKGVEVGMDTNGRKNRIGHIMEDLVEKYIVLAGFKKNVTYFKEMYKSQIEKDFKIDLSDLSNDSKTEKRFDFVIKTPSTVYAIETNFYSSGGSKLNETARSYELLAKQSSAIKNFKFIWLTDGIGWNSARNNLKQTFDILEDIYNLNDLKSGILKKVIK